MLDRLIETLEEHVNGWIMQLLRKPQVLESLHGLLDEPYEVPVRNTLYYPLEAEQAIAHLQKPASPAAALSSQRLT